LICRPHRAFAPRQAGLGLCAEHAFSQVTRLASQADRILCPAQALSEVSRGGDGMRASSQLDQTAVRVTLILRGRHKR